MESTPGRPGRVGIEHGKNGLKHWKEMMIKWIGSKIYEGTLERRMDIINAIESLSNGTVIIVNLINYTSPKKWIEALEGNDD